MPVTRTLHLDDDIHDALGAYARREGVSEHAAVNRILRFGLAATLSDLAASAHLARHAATPLPKGEDGEQA